MTARPTRSGYSKTENGSNLKVSQALNSQDICHWTRQLCLAATALERIGLIYGDIRPENMILDVDRNLKLSDFDRGMKTEEDIAVLTEPYGRLLDAADDGGADTYGTAGARTVTFAIGSVFRCLGSP
jgi:serine/threonine protein kinase